MNIATILAWVLASIIVGLFLVVADVVFFVLSMSFWEAEFLYRGGPPIEIWQRILVIGFTCIFLSAQLIGLVVIIRSIWKKRKLVRENHEKIE